MPNNDIPSRRMTKTPKVTACNLTEEWLTLNVGGTLFTTTRSTLTRVDSMLSKMFQKDSIWSSATDKSGAYLIDRTPMYFGPILHFLRTGNIIIEPNVDPSGVLDEARFFGVIPVVEHLENLLNEKQLRSQVNFTRNDFIQILVQANSNNRVRCQGLNLEGIDLSCLDLRYVNFKHANLKNANLQNCDCAYASFECADLSGANLEGADFSGAIFCRTNLEKANMKRCNFEDPVTGQGANFGGANLNEAQLEDSNLVKANLRVSSLRNANLTNCNLRGAVLAGADLKDCNLTGCNLQLTNLRGANFSGAIFDLASPIHMSMSI